MTVAPATAPRRDERLLGARLQRELTSQACRGVPITYRRLSGLLSLADPAGSPQLRSPLEALMEEDAFAGRPFIAALAVSAVGGGLPAPWFFRKAERLGPGVDGVHIAAMTLILRAKHELAEDAPTGRKASRREWKEQCWVAKELGDMRGLGGVHRHGGDIDLRRREARHRAREQRICALDFEPQ